MSPPSVAGMGTVPLTLGGQDSADTLPKVNLQSDGQAGPKWVTSPIFREGCMRDGGNSPVKKLLTEHKRIV